MVKNWAEALKRFSLTSPFAIVLGVAAFLVQGFFSSDTKARIVFWKFKGNPHPGAEAFSKWMYADSRIDPHIIRSRYDPLPQDANKQNALWYKLLKKHEGNSGVDDAHRRYLLARDLSTNWLLFGVLSAIAVWWGPSDVLVKLTFVLMTAFVFLLMTWVARNHGHRLITNTLAVESAA